MKPTKHQQFYLVSLVLCCIILSLDPVSAKNWVPPAPCIEAKAMFDAAGIDLMQLEMTASQLDESGMSYEEVDAQLANTFFVGDQEAMDRLFDYAEATGASFDMCMPPDEVTTPSDPSTITTSNVRKPMAPIN